MLRSAAVAMRRPVVTTERLGAVARITMNRPEVRNAQDSALILALDDAMRAGADERVRVVILAGAGPSFSSGHDLKPVVGEAEEDAWRKVRATPKGRLRHERELCVEKCLAIYHLPKPTVAQVQGHCVAAGLMLAAMCDLIVASRRCRVLQPGAPHDGSGRRASDRAVGVARHCTRASRSLRVHLASARSRTRTCARSAVAEASALRT